MRDKIKAGLLKLSKQQLIKIIENYNTYYNFVSNTLVQESKCHIESKEAIERIRDYSCQYTYSLYDIDLDKIIDRFSENTRHFSGEMNR